MVFSGNDRCDQENLIEQLKNGVHAMHAPVDNLHANWAYMVMTALAWNLKMWWALRLPEKGCWAQKHRREKQVALKMEFRTFVNYMMKIPCQIIRTGGAFGLSAPRVESLDGYPPSALRRAALLTPVL